MKGQERAEPTNRREKKDDGSRVPGRGPNVEGAWERRRVRSATSRRRREQEMRERGKGQRFARAQQGETEDQDEGTAAVDESKTGTEGATRRKSGTRVGVPSRLSFSVAVHSRTFPRPARGKAKKVSFVGACMLWLTGRAPHLAGL